MRLYTRARRFENDRVVRAFRSKTGSANEFILGNIWFYENIDGFEQNDIGHIKSRGGCSDSVLAPGLCTLLATRRSFVKHILPKIGSS